MKDYVTLLSNWGPVIALLALAILGIILSLAGSLSLEEKRMNGQDDEHYVLRQPLSRVGKPLVLLVIGVAIVFVTSFLQRFLPEPAWLLPVIRLALAVIFGLVFWKELARVVRQRVFVNGDQIRVTPAFGPAIETTFSQIRTVANKVVGGDGGVVGKKIKTKEGTRFEVINTMDGYERFCEQLDEKVELPNLTKKLFKKKGKEEAVEENWEATQQETPLPQPSMESAAGNGEAILSEETAATEGVVLDTMPAAEGVIQTDASTLQESAVATANAADAVAQSADTVVSDMMQTTEGAIPPEGTPLENLFPPEGTVPQEPMKEEV